MIRMKNIEKLDEEELERLGWLILAEKSLAEIWDNPKDEEVWKKYLEED